MDMELIPPSVPLPDPKKAKAEMTKANVHHNMAVRAGQSLVEHMLQSGQHLQRSKDAVGHGRWLDYLDEHGQMGRRMAAYYLDLYDKWEGLGEPMKKHIRSLTSMRQIIAAISGKKENTTRLLKKQTKRDRDVECSFHGCKSPAVFVSQRCGRHRVAAVIDLLHEAEREELQEMQRIISRLLGDPVDDDE